MTRNVILLSIHFYRVPRQFTKEQKKIYAFRRIIRENKLFFESEGEKKYGLNRG